MNKLNENLRKYLFIEKYYSKYLDEFTRKNHILIYLLKNDRNCLKKFDEILKDLDNIPNLSHLIKKSRNPRDFLSIFSEMKILHYLIGKVEKASVIVSHKSSPDFKIRKSNFEITIEVKRIIDKYEALTGISPTHSEYAYEIDDISTITNATTKSIEGKQYFQSSAHLFVFDCASGIYEEEFADIFCSQRGKAIPLKNGRFGIVTDDGLFYEKGENGKFLYEMISGVVAIFSGQTISFDPDLQLLNIKGPRKIYFENPNASKKLPRNLVEEIGFQIFKPLS